MPAVPARGARLAYRPLADAGAHSATNDAATEVVTPTPTPATNRPATRTGAAPASAIAIAPRT